MKTLLQILSVSSCLLLVVLITACSDDSDGPTLTVTNFLPDSGPVGTMVDIYVENMEPATAVVVTFNDRESTSVWFGGAGRIVAEVPAFATTGKISVRVKGKTATSQKTFTVTN